MVQYESIQILWFYFTSKSLSLSTYVSQSLEKTNIFISTLWFRINFDQNNQNS